MKIYLLVLIWPAFVKAFVGNTTSCPDLLLTPLPSHLPLGLQRNLTGIKLLPTKYTNFNDCVIDCCSTPTCNAALTVNKEDSEQCWLVTCQSDDLCLPSEEFGAYESTLVLVRPNNPPWPNVSVPVDTVCEIGLDADTCHAGEVCVRLGSKSKSRNGVCRCDENHISTKDGCVLKTPSSPPGIESTTPVPIVPIAVSVANKTIRLPESTTTLTAFTIKGSKDQIFKYEWKTQTPNLPGTESDSNSDTLRLSSLVEGVYIFKVIVTSTSPNGYGETFANVTVLPKQRINTPPKAVIVPVNQTVNLPTSSAIIDGSKSNDDGDKLTYSWAITSGPMGYEPELPQIPTLTLEKLIPGNYTIKLTVKDEDGAEDSATSFLMVLKETDYPPKANAGEDKIIYLPQNTVVLDGSLSSDDHEIASWEWTKKKPEDGVELPADITGARTPYLTVANLEKGIYNFVLKVTDSAGQSKTDQVSVYVKTPLNLPPTANAGEDQEVSLPLPYITLDGSKSTDDLKVTKYAWKQVEGPKNVNISKPANAITNVTNLAPGTFKFQLTVSDGNNNNATDIVVVKIKQDSNQAPVSKIVQPDKLRLPLHYLVLDGSQSTDDLAVERWQWTRNPESVSAGTIVGASNGSMLTLTNLVHGIYSFSLKVWDAQGKSDLSRVSFTVEDDPDTMSGVEMILDKYLYLLSQSELDNILEAIKIFVKSKSGVELVSVTPARRSGFATIVFKVPENLKYMKGSTVVSALKKTLSTNPDLLGVPVLSLDTLVCQNQCGGHGACDEQTRECHCQPFWLENPIRKYFQQEPNCDWSVIYVSVIFLGIFILVLILNCVYCGCCRKKKKYSRLSDGGGIELTGEPVNLISSDSDSDDEDILFESAKKGRRVNGVLKSFKENGSTKDSFIA